MFYIIKANYKGKDVVIGKKSNVNNTFYYEMEIPNLNDKAKFVSFWKKFKKLIKIYKSKRFAEKFVKALSMLNPSFKKVEIVEINQEVLHFVYDGCPNCGSKRVLERSYQLYEQIFLLDTDKKESEWTDKIGIVEDNKDREYVCADCMFNLDMFDLSEYSFDKV